MTYPQFPTCLLLFGLSAYTHFLSRARYSMHGRSSEKNVMIAAAKTDEEALSLEVGSDEGDTLMDIEVKYLCCPTTASE